MAEFKPIIPPRAVHKVRHQPFTLPDFGGQLPPLPPHQGFVPMPFASATEKPMEESVPVEQEGEPIAPEPEAVAPSFSEEQLEEARREAEAIGREKGYQDAKREWNETRIARETQILALLESLGARMQQEHEENVSAREALRSHMTHIVLMVARKMAGSALELQPLGAVEGMVGECLSMLAGEPRMTIHVAEALQEPLKAYLSRIPRADGQVIEVLSAPMMQPGDCHIQWHEGKAERNQEALWQEMEQIITRALTAKVENKG